MIFVIGGNSQGKRNFAQNHLKLTENDISDGDVCEIGLAFKKPILDKLTLFIGRLITVGIDPIKFVLEGIKENSDITIVSDEIGCGIIPISHEDRDLRETVGRVQCEIAKKADKVYRVYCSIPVLIKGEEK